MKIRSHLLFVVLLVFTIMFAGCGGGGGGGSGSDRGGSGGSATITGSVGGTKVVAYDENDNEVDSDIAAGSPKTFALTIPLGGNYRFYLIENEGTANERVYSLYQGSTNIFTISSAVTIDLGFVNTSTGVAVPTNNPLNASGVSSGGENTSVPSSLSGSVFLTSDLQGTWNIHLLTSGDSPQWTGWGYGPASIDGSGNVTWTSITRSDGDSSLPSPTTLSITSGGIVSGSGVMSQDKNMIVFTMDDGGGGYNLMIYQKSGGTFAMSDLQGTRNYIGLISGDSPNQKPGWYRGSFTIDSNGTVTHASTVTDSLGNSNYTPTFGTMNISSSGVFTTSGVASYRGVMNINKDMIITTATMAPGNANDVNGYNLQILLK